MCIIKSIIHLINLLHIDKIPNLFSRLLYFLYFRNRIPSIINKFVLPLVNIVYKVLFIFLPKKNNFIKSVYGPYLQTRKKDSTFLMATLGCWGFYLNDYLISLDKEFVLLDVGSNMGLYSLVALSNLNCKFCFCIEPGTENRELLNNNLKFNKLAKKAKVFPFAIANKNTTGKLYISENNCGRSNMLFKKGKSEDIELRNYELFNEISSNYETKNIFVKIDVEGFEPIVIEELFKSNLINRVNDIFIEFTPKLYKSNDFEKMKDIISKYNFVEIWRSKGIVQYDIHFKRI